MAAEELEIAIGKVLRKFGIDKLKKEQKQMLELLLERKDCMAVLPTGYGKSLPYQMLVSVKRELEMEDDASKVIVCSPLVALMLDQCERLNGIPGIRAVQKGSNADDEKDIEDGNFQYLFSSPEILVGDKVFRSKLQQYKVSTIVVDEVHTISTWGQSDEKKEAFRKWFGDIGELRSLFPRASILALSATCTKKISRRVYKVLDLGVDTIEIRISPNKPNIKVAVHKIPNSLEMSMSWIVDALNEEKLPRCILFCKSIKDASNMYTYIVTEIPNCTVVEMFHSETPKENKEKIIDGLKNPNSDLKLLIATTALGMGIDCVNFNNVIIYGMPTCVVDLIQEIGRIGRDSQKSVALILYNSYSFHVDDEVKNILKTTECRRKAMMEPFLKEKELGELEMGSEFCCDLCYTKSDEKSSIFGVEKLFFCPDFDTESDFSNSSSESDLSQQDVLSDN
ncbi:probable ATP-dependent DNA helicase RecS [Ostrea edulis]|nr:probable ATP-dependent DNA helicase RecS [Ostrea edulis]